MIRGLVFCFFLALAAPPGALAGNSVSIGSRTAKVLDESADEVCRLTRKTKVEAVALIEDSDLVKVKLPIKGCPEEGYIPKKYLQGSLKGLPTQSIEAIDMPVEDCVDCGAKPPPAVSEQPLEVILKLLGELEDSTEENPLGRNFAQVAKKWNANKDDRKLVQIPTMGTLANIGPCGSHHYNGDEPQPPGIDAYVTPFTGCLMTAVMQEWRKNFCLYQSGCTLQWGDASHGQKKKFPPHSTHRDGTCIDIRPMRKGGFEDAPLTYKSDNYDRDTTKKLVGLLKEMGASKIIFNDPEIDVSRARKHANHIHVCFEPNEISEKTCKNLKVEQKLCRELP
jgi:hypothetical protein